VVAGVEGDLAHPSEGHSIWGVANVLVDGGDVIVDRKIGHFIYFMIIIIVK
jgi:hypothetical protein